MVEYIKFQGNIKKYAFNSVAGNHENIDMYISIKTKRFLLQPNELERSYSKFICSLGQMIVFISHKTTHAINCLLHNCSSLDGYKSDKQ